MRRLTWAPSLRKGPGLLAHPEILWRLGGYEPDKGAATAGSQCYFLTGPGALLNQSLIAYGLKFLLALTPEHGSKYI